MRATPHAAMAAIHWVKDRVRGAADDPLLTVSLTTLVAGMIAAILVALAFPAAAQTQSIQFSAEVPPAPAQMQVYKLTVTAPPLDFLNEKLSAAKLPPLAKEQDRLVARGATGAEATDQVRAFVDADTGNAHFLPNLAELVRPDALREAIPLERVREIARQALTDSRFIPKDVTEARIDEPITVMAGGAAQPGSETAAVATDTLTAPRPVMSIVPAFRYAGGLRVYGRGSHALVSLANDGTVIGALRRWRTAASGRMFKPAITAEAVRADIQRQLAPSVAREGTKADVDKITLAYYDADETELRPVYYFEATVTPPEPKISPFKIAGFVPIGKSADTLPDLAAQPAGPGPDTPKRPAAGVDPGRMGAMATPGDFTLGEYANQDWPNNGAYVDMANTFLSGLTSVSGHGPITRTQWYVAYAWEVVGPQSKYFMNAVNVAYTEPHGDWLTNSTLSNCCDIWYVPNIGSGGNPGFGHAAGGDLATWIIMSCEVIPSMYDRQYEQGGAGNPQTAFDAWWGVFQGLHNAIVFRTVMFYPDDALQYGFGRDAAQGGDLNAAWFQEVAAVDGNDGTYTSQHLKNGTVVHYDRASTMIDARDLGQSIYSVGPQSASTQLWNFWMGN